jgi:cyclopropane fatty-acyl-phospholipid synthase-like methyltransferase
MTYSESVFRSAHGKGIAGDVVQWGGLATVAQYRLPYERTIAHLSPGDHVLDWGCGNGHFSFFLTQHGLRTVGLSFEDAPAAIVDEPLFRHVRHDDPVGLPFSDGLFDSAASVGVLEHVHETGGDQQASLVELARVLKPGGTLLVFHLPNALSWIECLVRQINPWLRKPVFQHSRLFTRADVERLLPPDLAIVECGRYNLIPRNPANALPAWLRNSRTFVAGLNLLDDTLTAILPMFAQNWFFVLRKTTEHVAGPAGEATPARDRSPS